MGKTLSKSPKKNSFFEQVYEVAKLIPEGRVTSYGAIAKFLGAPRSARMVGWAMNACNSHHEYVPAHRVVNRNGILTAQAKFPGANIMAELLESENIQIEEGKIINFKEVFWDPTEHLDLEV